MTKIISYGKQLITAADIAAVVKTLKSDYLTQGKAIDKFESALADICGVKYAVAFSSGTAALHGACIAAGIRPNTEVITPPLTFVASANCVLYCGGKPVFVDVQSRVPLIDWQLIEKKLTSKTRAIISVDYSGMPADYDELRLLARKYKLVLIADAAHSLGAVYRNNPVGSLADMTVFSFHPVKAVTTGEGGMVVTDKREYYEILKIFRSHGITKEYDKLKYKSQFAPWYYEMQMLGFNYRMTDIQAALGASQVKRLGKLINRRQQIAGIYLKAFSDQKYVDMLDVPEDRISAWHIFPLLLKTKKLQRNKKNIFTAFLNSGIRPQVHFIPIHLHPFYRKLGYSIGDFPQAEKFYREELTLPLYPDLTDKQLHFIITVTKKCLTEFAL